MGPQDQDEKSHKQAGAELGNICPFLEKVLQYGYMLHIITTDTMLYKQDFLFNHSIYYTVLFLASHSLMVPWVAFPETHSIKRERKKERERDLENIQQIIQASFNF